VVYIFSLPLPSYDDSILSSLELQLELENTMALESFALSSMRRNHELFRNIGNQLLRRLVFIKNS